MYNYQFMGTKKIVINIIESNLVRSSEQKEIAEKLHAVHCIYRISCGFGSIYILTMP